jgi:hypothetical protein
MRVFTVFSLHHKSVVLYALGRGGGRGVYKVSSEFQTENVKGIDNFGHLDIGGGTISKVILNK